MQVKDDMCQNLKVANNFSFSSWCCLQLNSSPLLAPLLVHHLAFLFLGFHFKPPYFPQDVLFLDDTRFSSILRFLRDIPLKSSSSKSSKLNVPDFGYFSSVSCFRECYQHLFKSIMQELKKKSLIKYEERGGKVDSAYKSLNDLTLTYFFLLPTSLRVVLQFSTNSFLFPKLLN